VGVRVKVEVGVGVGVFVDVGVGVLVGVGVGVDVLVGVGVLVNVGVAEANKLTTGQLLRSQALMPQARTDMPASSKNSRRVRWNFPSSRFAVKMRGHLSSVEVNIFVIIPSHSWS
jgi:hypothetical protein